MAGFDICLLILCFYKGFKEALHELALESDSESE